MCLMVSLMVHAGPRDFTKLVYNADKDFNGIFIYTVVQDEDGFLWIGSDDGLYRFDGREMLNLNKRDTTINTLVTASMVSGDGHLYLGYYEGGVSKVEHGQYRKVLESKELPNKIVRLRRGEGNIVWGLTQNQGVIRIEGDSVTQFNLPRFSEVISNDFFVTTNRLLVGTNEGLLMLDITADGLTDTGFMSGTEGLAVNSVYQDDHDQGLVWIGTNDGMFTHFKHSAQLDNVPGFPEHVQVSSIAKDDLNTLWVGTRNHGLIEVDLDFVNVTAITFFDKKNGFESNQIGEVYVDDENEVWVGTFGRGLVQLNRAYFHHYELLKNLKVQGVHSIANYHTDELLLGTENGLVHVYNEPMRDSLIFEVLQGIGNYSFVSIAVDDSGIIWGGTEGDGLVQIDLQNKSVKSISLNPGDYMETPMIRDIQIDNDGFLWVSASGNGVYKLSAEGEVLLHMNTRNGFYHNEIYSIYPDEAGNVWFGSHAAGLALLPKNGEMQFLSKDEIFPSFDVNTIIQGDAGMIWITTEGAGIYSFDGENFRQYTEKDGLLSNFCNAVMIDDIGQVWIGHRLGITLLKPDIDVIHTFNHPSELGETEAELNAVCKDHRGNIYFGNPFGMTKVNLPHFNFAERKRQTHIKEIRLFFENRNLLQYSRNKKLDNRLPRDLKFPHDQNHLTFDFVSINLRNPEAIYYQYMLEGYDKVWSPVNKDDQATYTNLDPGYYTFKVRQSDHEDHWDNEFESIRFKINYPYWEMWWFYLLQISFILMVIVVTYYLSGYLKNQFAVRLMVYISLFISFEYIHTELEPYLDKFSGETPIFQVGVNLLLALLLLPIEIKLSSYLKKRARRIKEKHDRLRKIRESIKVG